MFSPPDSVRPAFSQLVCFKSGLSHQLRRHSCQQMATSTGCVLAKEGGLCIFQKDLVYVSLGPGRVDMSHRGVLPMRKLGD